LRPPPPSPLFPYTTLFRSPADYVTRTNSDLANDLGNLLNRTVAMVNQYLGGEIPSLGSVQNDFDSELEAVAAEAIEGFNSSLERSEEHTSELQSRFDLVCR